MFSVLNWPPKATLDLTAYVQDVNPKLLGLDFQLHGNLVNSVTYFGLGLRDQYDSDWLMLDSQYEEAMWSGSGTAIFGYYQGFPSLFPFDNYSYTIDLSPTQNLNFSQVFLNGKDLPINGTIPVHVPTLLDPTNASQTSDLSAWNMTTTARFVTNSKYSPTLEISVTLTRQSQLTDYYIIIPALALYAFLGVSVFLTGEGDLTNRLFIYLSIFLFVYAFLSVIRSLPLTPFYTGFSFADLLGIALVPCTVVMAFASVARWRLKSTKSKTWADVLGSLLAFAVLFLMVQVQVPSWNGHFVYVSHSFVAIWPWGPLFAISLLLGPIFIGTSKVVQRART